MYTGVLEVIVKVWLAKRRAGTLCLIEGIFKSYKSASIFAADYTSNKKEKWIVDKKDVKNRPISWVSAYHGAEFILEHHEAR